MDLTLDAFMTQLGEASSGDAEASATGLMVVAEAVAKRAKKDYGLSIDAAQYVLKDWTSDISKKGVKDAEKEDRFVESYISTIAKDRDSEAILPEGIVLDDYKTLPVVLFGHQYGELGVGKNIWIKPNVKSAVTQMHSLLARTVFASEKANPKADQVYNWSIEDMPIGDSIGFIPVDFVEPQDKGWDKLYDLWVKRTTAFLASKKREATADMLEGVRRIFTKVILLEYSKVMVPSNPFAVSLAVEKGLLLESQVKAFTIPEPKELVDDVARIDNTEYVADIDVTKVLDDAGKALVGEWKFIEDASSEDFLGLKEGRTLSKKTTTIVTTARNALTELLDANAIEVAAESGENTESGKSLTKANGMWNKTLPKSFDIAEYDQANTVFRYELFTKFLECQVKEIYVNTYDIPSPLIGTYLEAISVVTAGMNVDDTRRFSYDGKESPPRREYIQLNSEKRKRFLTNGSEYCHDGEMALVKDFSPGWRGLEFAIVTSTENEEKSDEIMNAIHAETDTNHMLKGERFALSGEFLSDTGDSWDDLVIATKDRQAIQKSMKITRNADGNSRGLMFVGPPGTGKTKAGRTIMNDTESTFIWVSARDFMYGWPDQILALAFDMSRKLAPTVLFMEDVDTSLDKDLLKTELDGLKQNKGIMTILTTNHPDRLPKALIDRPGRFHHILLFDLPDSGQRKEMFKLWAGDIETKILDVLVDSTDGFSGAHIYHLVEYSQDIAEAEELTIGKALLESLLRMTDQIELVEGLSTTQTKELFNEKDLRQSADDEVEITPELAQWLLEQDDQEKQAAEDGAPLTAAEKLLIATNHYV